MKETKIYIIVLAVLIAENALLILLNEKWEWLSLLTPIILVFVIVHFLKLDNQLAKSKEEKTTLKRELTQNIAHELKTPVASIRGYLETIIENPDIPEDTKQQFIVKSHEQTERLSSLLHDISTLSKMDYAPEISKQETVNISLMVADIVKESHMELEQRMMAFHNQIPDSISIQGESSLLYSIFRNLTDNAIAYAGEGATITLTAKEQPNYWSFTFKDNGTGVAPEHLPRLFERFYRVDKGRSRKMGGTGLGLAIVKNAVLLHSGKITVKNENGLRFDFSLKKESVISKEK